MRMILLLLLLGGAAYIGYQWYALEPSHDRTWQPHYERVPQVAQGEDVYVIENVRNWSYATTGESTAEEWLTATIAPSELEEVYFLMEPFGQFEGIAHTMLAFRFANDETYVVSIEARREVGEEYQPLRAAVLPTHEYLYLWTTERDMYANTVFVAGDDLYRYPLELDERQRRLILTTVLQETHSVARQPRWYHTLLANCTNVLAEALNQKSDTKLTFGVAWILPGYADTYLADRGYIDAGVSTEERRTDARLNEYVPQAYREIDPAAFSRTLNDIVQATEATE